MRGVTFPEPGTYVRYFDNAAKLYKFARVMERQAPLVYRRRLGSVAPGSKLSNPVIFKDLDPSNVKKHRYLLYLGVSGGGLFYPLVPYDTKILKWDVDPPDETDGGTGFSAASRSDLIGWISAKESPIDAPTFSVWVQPDLYPAVQVLNDSQDTIVPSVVWYGAKYVWNDQLNAAELAALNNGTLPFLPISFGGDV